MVTIVTGVVYGILQLYMLYLVLLSFIFFEEFRFLYFIDALYSLALTSAKIYVTFQIFLLMVVYSNNLGVVETMKQRIYLFIIITFGLQFVQFVFNATLMVFTWNNKEELPYLFTVAKLFIHIVVQVPFYIAGITYISDLIGILNRKRRQMLGYSLV